MSISDGWSASSWPVWWLEQVDGQVSWYSRASQFLLSGRNFVQHVYIYQVYYQHLISHESHSWLFTFYCISIFDGLLFRPPTRDDLPQYEEVQRILREEIVNPLRQNHYVRADKVMKLRRLLQKLGSVTGLTTEEKGMPLSFCYLTHS